MIKLDIISGFLGAGKTTFIKRILKAFEKSEENIVVIVNEFGDIGIDGDLVEQEGYEFYEISKGCLCCSLKEDFAATLLKIEKDIAPDRVILEPSGIFVVQEAIELIRQERLADKYRLNHLVTIVDSLYFSKHYRNIGLFLEKQIQSASKLLLSKVQLIEKEKTQKLVMQLRDINPSAEILSENWENYSNEDIIEMLGIKKEESEGSKDAFSALHSFNIKHNYDCYGIETGKIYDKDTVEQLLEKIAEGRYGKVIRSKGILLGNPNNIEFQYIEGSYNIEAFEKNIENGKLTFIGEAIEREILMNEIFNK